MSVDLGHNHAITSYYFQHKLVLYNNLFSPIMEHLIFSQENDTLTVLIYGMNLQPIIEFSK